MQTQSTSHCYLLVTATSKVQQQTDSRYVVIFCYLVLTHILSIYRPDEDIEMKVCEPYSLHQSKPTDNIYDECQPPVDTSVYEYM